MKCEKCGFQTNPGDQICINCGNKLPLTTISTVEDIVEMNSTISNVAAPKEEKKSNKLLFFIIGGVVLLIAIVVVVLLVLL